MAPMRSDRGQATVEYILMMAVVVGFFMIVSRGLARSGLAFRLARPITGDFAMAYKYGHPQAKGQDEGGWQMHPRYENGNNFRIFINPKQ